MIRPNEVPKPTPNPQDIQEQERIEKYFDDALRGGNTCITMPRSGWLVSNISRVLDKYRANGWRVTDTGMAYVFEPAESASQG